MSVCLLSSFVGEQPAAITDVDYADRPDYICTDEHTIQKAYGQR